MLGRQYLKRNALLHVIRRSGTAGRTGLAKELKISNSRVCDLVQEMLDEGLLEEESLRADRRGRKGVPLSLKSDFGYIVGFDMEAKRLRLVAVDFSGDLVWQKQIALIPPGSRQELLETLLDFILKGINEIREQFNPILGIGLAGPGCVAVEQGVILHYDLLDSATNIPLRDLVSGPTGLPCLLEDNMRAMTLAEWMNGAGKHLNSFICLSVRSGVGAGIVINGKLHVGSHGFAGQMGTSTLPVGNLASQWKHLHDIASEKALNIDGEIDGSELPLRKANRAGELLGVQLANMAGFLDPEAIVLAGTLIQPDGVLFDPMVKSFRRTLLPEISDRVQMLPARLGPFSAALGATHCCFEMLYPLRKAGSVL